MNISIDSFLSRLDGAKPFFRDCNFGGPDDPLFALTRKMGQWRIWTDEAGVPHGIEWDSAGPHFAERGKVVRLRAEDVSMRTLDVDAFVAAVGTPFGCAAVCKPLVPGRLFDLGPCKANIGRCRRRIVLAVRLGPLDGAILQAVPSGREVLLVVGGNRLERPGGDLGERTFTLRELAVGFRDGAFDLDLRSVEERFRAREGVPERKANKNRIRNIRRVKTALAAFWKSLKTAYHDKGEIEMRRMTSGMKPAVLARMTRLGLETVYSIIDVKSERKNIDDPQARFLWMACSSPESFLASLKIGTDIAGFVSVALKEVSRYSPEDRELAWEDRPL